MDFGSALSKIKQGATMARSGWNGRGMYVVFSPGFKLPAQRVFTPAIRDEIGDDMGVFRSYLMMRTANGEFVPWVPSQSDLLDEDWIVVRP